MSLSSINFSAAEWFRSPDLSVYLEFMPLIHAPLPDCPAADDPDIRGLNLAHTADTDHMERSAGWRVSDRAQSRNTLGPRRNASECQISRRART